VANIEKQLLSKLAGDLEFLSGCQIQWFKILLVSQELTVKSWVKLSQFTNSATVSLWCHRIIHSRTCGQPFYTVARSIGRGWSRVKSCLVGRGRGGSKGGVFFSHCLGLHGFGHHRPATKLAEFHRPWQLLKKWSSNGPFF
jgi:hypothetical protein